MTLAVDVTNMRGPSNEKRHNLQTKKTKVGLYIAARSFSCPLLLTTWSTLVLKVGALYGWRTILKETSS